MTNEEAIKVLNTIDNCLKGNGYDWEHEGIKTAMCGQRIDWDGQSIESEGEEDEV